ncbi:ribonuclease HII [Aquimarina brevivitae]|uniref:Uncharacterized protein n=1 Tax=Aquimarina brevivitae TaxID=323412 RepID=A0A4V2F5A7_9FLAO|nr:ribonuclease HII [Aquimarina brevivitae]RZS92159.1 hypothetical protein EV197_2794 [Aquimarina brevivitae]
MKNIFIVFLSLAVCACSEPETKSISFVDYVPKDAQIIVKINDLEQAKSQLRNNDLIKNNTGLDLYTYFNQLPALQKTSKKSALLCFSPVGKNDYEYTLISKIDQLLITKDSLSNKKVEKFSYAEKDIYKISEADQAYFSTIADSIIISSSSQLVIENVIREQKNLVKAPSDLKRVYEVASSETPLSFLINGNKLYNLQQNLLPKDDIIGIKKFSGWASMDASIAQNSIYLNGIVVEKDSLPSVLGIFNKTLPQENKIAKITPVTANGFISYTYDDFDILKNNLASIQEREYHDIPVEFDELFASVTEVGLIYNGDDTLLALTALNTDELIEELQGDKVNTFRDISIYKHDNQISFAGIFNPLLADFKEAFYFQFEEFIVFATSQKALQDIIANILNTSVLGVQPYYTSLKDKLADRSSILMVGNISYLKEHIANNGLDTYKEGWNNFNHKGYEIGIVQLIRENDFAHVHTLLQKSQDSSVATSVAQVASVTLENELLSAPVLVKNHRTKGLDIAAQDITNHLYLISDTGTIFWKKQIDGAIMGEIQQIDMYKNGRYQLLFNTANTLYVVDRDGKDVTPFPKKFEQTITQPLALFDYDKNKRYRIVITQGNNILMFDAKGEVVEGFGFNGTKTKIIAPPKHIRIGTKDYILVQEENGKLNILDRIGRTRVDVKGNIDFSTNEWYQYQDLFTSTTKAGGLIQIDAKGGINKKEIGLEENHQVTMTNKTLVTLSENKLTIKDRTLELDYGIYTAPKLFYINNKIYISVTDKQTKKVYLYDSNAELFPNFPVYGNSAISLGNMDNDPKLEFAVKGDDNTILIYQIN